MPLNSGDWGKVWGLSEADVNKIKSHHKWARHKAKEKKKRKLKHKRSVLDPSRERAPEIGDGDDDHVRETKHRVSRLGYASEGGRLVKTCPDCGQEKDFDDFSLDSSRKSGFDTYCLECRKERRTRQRRPTPAEYRDQKRRYRANKKRASAAHDAVRRAIKTGGIVRQPCEICGDSESVAHHDSYAWEDRLNVRWLCVDHHAELHRKQRRKEVMG